MVVVWKPRTYANPPSATKATGPKHAWDGTGPRPPASPARRTPRSPKRLPCLTAALRGLVPRGATTSRTRDRRRSSPPRPRGWLAYGSTTTPVTPVCARLMAPSGPRRSSRSVLRALRNGTGTTRSRAAAWRLRERHVDAGVAGRGPDLAAAPGAGHGPYVAVGHDALPALPLPPLPCAAYRVTRRSTPYGPLPSARPSSVRAAGDCHGSPSPPGRRRRATSFPPS